MVEKASRIIYIFKEAWETGSKKKKAWKTDISVLSSSWETLKNPPI